MKRVLFVISVACLAACQKKLTLNHYKWSAQGADSNSSPIPPNLFATPDTTVKLFDEIVENSRQKVGGAIIDSSYQQKISSTKGRLQFINAQFEEQSFAQLKASAEKLHNLRFAALEVVKRKNLELKNALTVFEPEVYISGSEEAPKLQYQFEFIPKNGAGVYSMRVSPSYAIESIKRVESCFQESRSFVFPSGPKFSELIETFLSPLIGDGSLTSPRVVVGSDDGRKVNSENGEFIFSTEDPRFDHVQAFFFAQKALTYAETHWDFNLPFPLKIELKAGYPEKTDLMYYRKHVIRLGEGGSLYKNIPRDPSIVTHEVAHSIIDAISSMGSEGESGSLNEGFADYITASLWEIPELGHTAYLKRPFTRTVDVKTLYTERNGGTYHDSGVLSGTFWEIEKQLGAVKTQKLALKTIARLGTQPVFSDVYVAVLDAANASSFTTEDIQVIKNTFVKRAWPVTQ